MDLKPYGQKALEIVKTKGIETLEAEFNEVFMPIIAQAVLESPTKIDDAIYAGIENKAKELFANFIQSLKQ